MKPTKEQLKNCIKKIKEEEKEREKKYKEWRASLKQLKKKVSVFSFRLPPPNPDLMKDQKIKERYLYDLWQLEKSPNSGHLNIDIEFRGLEEEYEFIIYFLDKKYNVKEYFDPYPSRAYNNLHIKRVIYEYWEDLAPGHNANARVSLPRWKFDDFWKDLLQFCEERDYIFPTVVDPILRSWSEDFEYNWWEDKIR